MKKTKLQSWWPRLGAVLLFVLFCLAGTTSVYWYMRVHELEKGSSVPADDVTWLVERVGELIVLPTDEIPAAATVTDPELLRDQQFFAQAKAGDRVLLYSQAKRAILYDPVAHKIIEIAPLDLGADSEKPEPESLDL